MIQRRHGCIHGENAVESFPLAHQCSGDVEERINTGDVHHFLGDQMDGIGVRFHADLYSRCRGDELLRLRGPVVSPVPVVAARRTPVIARSAVIAPRRKGSIPAAVALPVIATWRSNKSGFIHFNVCFRFFRGSGHSIARPRRTQVKCGQKAVGRMERVAHAANRSKENGNDKLIVTFFQL